MNTLDRFWSKVDDSAGPHGCWPWLAHTSADGYGQFAIGARGRAVAHRFAYEAAVGAIPAGLQLDHLCRQRNCCNPSHLEPVTNRVNVLRGVGPTAMNAAKTHCINGHEFTPENTVMNKKGRACRACGLATSRRYYERRKEMTS